MSEQQVGYGSFNPFIMPKLTPDLPQVTHYAGYVGIDPGASGAIAFLGEDGGLNEVFDCPESPSDLWSILRARRHIDVRLAVIEKVSAMPKQGVVSMFKFGQNFGMWQMAAAAMGWPYEFITPHRWRKTLDSSVPPKPTKEDLRQYALRVWGAIDSLRRKKDEGRAEAMLIARYARIKSMGLGGLIL